MENIKDLELEIKKKLENAFDIHHIYEVFSSLVTAINEQNEEIQYLRQELDDTRGMCQDLADNIKTIEYNIQGFDMNEKDEAPTELKIVDIVDVDPTKGVVKRSTLIDKKKPDSRPPTAQKRGESSAGERAPSASTSRKSSAREKASLSTDISPQEVAKKLTSPRRSQSPQDETPKQSLPSTSRGEGSPKRKFSTEIQLDDDEKDAVESARPNYSDVIIDTVETEDVVEPVKHSTQSDTKGMRSESHSTRKKAERNEPQQRKTVAGMSQSRAADKIIPAQKSEKTSPNISSDNIIDEVPPSLEIVTPPLDSLEPPLRLNYLHGETPQRTPEEEVQWKAKKRRVLYRMYAKMVFLISVTNTANSTFTRSKLDPKFTINNRIRDLETNVKALQNLAAVQRKALDAIPARIKSYIPSDLKSQVARLTNVLDRMENKGSNTSRSQSNVQVASGVISAQNIEGRFNDDCLNSLVSDIKERLNPFDSTQLNEKLSAYQFTEDQSTHIIKSLLQENVLKKVADRMINNGYLDDLAGKGVNNQLRRVETVDVEYEEMVKKQQTLAVVQEVTNRLISKDELLFLFDSSFSVQQNPPQNTPPTTTMINHSSSMDSMEISLSSAPPFVQTSSTMNNEENLSITPKSNVGEMVLRAPNAAENKQILNRLPSGSINDPSNYNQRRKITMIKGGIDGTELSEISDKFRQGLVHQIQVQTNELVRKQDLDERVRNLQTMINLELMNLKKSLIQDIVTNKLDGVMLKQNKLEKQVNDNVTSINNFDALLRQLMTEIERLKTNARGANDKSWKPELDKMTKQLSQNLLTQKEFTETLLKDLGSLQTDLSNRVDEKRLEELVNNLENKIQKSIVEGIDPVQNNIASIVRAIKNKADRKEMERLVAIRIAETEETLRKLEVDHDAAGVTRCISCGHMGKPTSPGASGLLNDNPELYQQSVLSWGANGTSEYDQVVAIMNRQAGLKPLNRHTKPMLPVVNLSRPVTAAGSGVLQSQGSTSSSKRDQNSKEPLYRRAKIANQLRETPKIPLVNFTPNSSLSSPAEVYHLDPKRDIPGNNNISNNNNQIKMSATTSTLPKGFASRPLSGI